MTKWGALIVLLPFLAGGNAALARDRAASVEAFRQIYRVTQHPRCLNCHPAGDAPLQGDDSHGHALGVKRGSDGKGLPEKRCVNCHQSANQAGMHRPPGAPHPARANQPAGTPRWHLPKPQSPLVFQGRTPAQLCRQLLNRATNGGLAPAALIGHVEGDPFVRWAWQPGEGRTTPPGRHQDLVDAVQSWVADGAACPVE